MSQLHIPSNTSVHSSTFSFDSITSSLLAKHPTGIYQDIPDGQGPQDETNNTEELEVEQLVKSIKHGISHVGLQHDCLDPGANRPCMEEDRSISAIDRADMKKKRDRKSRSIKEKEKMRQEVTKRERELRKKDKRKVKRKEELSLGMVKSVICGTVGHKVNAFSVFDLKHHESAYTGPSSGSCGQSASRAEGSNWAKLTPPVANKRHPKVQQLISEGWTYVENNLEYVS